MCDELSMVRVNIKFFEMPTIHFNKINEGERLVDGISKWLGNNPLPYNVRAIQHIGA